MSLISWFPALLCCRYEARYSFGSFQKLLAVWIYFPLVGWVVSLQLRRVQNFCFSTVFRLSFGSAIICRASDLFVAVLLVGCCLDDFLDGHVLDFFVWGSPAMLPFVDHRYCSLVVQWSCSLMQSLHGYSVVVSGVTWVWRLSHICFLYLVLKVVLRYWFVLSPSLDLDLQNGLLV